MTTGEYLLNQARISERVKQIALWGIIGTVVAFAFFHVPTGEFTVCLVAAITLCMFVTVALLERRLVCRRCHASLVEAATMSVRQRRTLAACPNCGADFDAQSPDTPFKWLR